MEAELKVLTDMGHTLQANDLIRHNMVVFSQGESALQVATRLVNITTDTGMEQVMVGWGGVWAGRLVA